MKKILSVVVVVSLLICLASCGKKNTDTQAEQKIEGIQIALSDNGITVDGVNITDSESESVYAKNDIVYYEDGHDFTYGAGDENDAHSKAEADAHTVVHIGKAGTYVLSGKISKGQIAVDLGEDAKSNPEAKVTLILNGVDITSTVAPSIIFYNVYECCSADTETANKTVDTKDAGATIKIADGTENTLNGSYVAKIYKSVELNEAGTEVVDSKKLHKYDGTLYSKMTMNIEGNDGILNVNAENEGIDSELHLTINGGVINIVSGDDGINTNEDGVSVTTINGGTLNIKIREGSAEGDGIDSNGWLVINGGNVFSQACSTNGDAGIDSDNGIYINGGTLFATGNMLDKISGGAQNYAVFTFRESQKSAKTYELQNANGDSIVKFAPENAFTYLIVSSPNLAGGDYSLLSGGTPFSVSEIAQNGMQGGFNGQRPDEMNGERPEMPQGEAPNGEKPQMPNGETPPDMPSGEIPSNMTPPQGEQNTPENKGNVLFTINAGGNNYSVY